MEWNNIQTKTEAECVFESIMENCIGKQKITNFFTDSYENLLEKENNKLSIDTDIYIEFEHHNCLVITFDNPSVLYLKYRKLNESEIKLSEEKKQQIKIIDDNTKIWNFKCHWFRHPYERWIQNGNLKGDSVSMITIPAGGDYFDQ